MLEAPVAVGDDEDAVEVDAVGPKPWSPSSAHRSRTSFSLRWTTCSLVEQQVGERQRELAAVEPLGQIELVAHREAVEQDVDGPPALRVLEVQAGRAVQGVEHLVGHVALLLDERGDRLAVDARGR